MFNYKQNFRFMTIIHTRYTGRVRSVHSVYRLGYECISTYLYKQFLSPSFKIFFQGFYSRLCVCVYMNGAYFPNKSYYIIGFEFLFPGVSEWYFNQLVLSVIDYTGEK